MFLEYKVINNNYKNINQILKQEFKLSARLMHKVIINKLVLLNNKQIDTRSSINIGDNVKIDLNYEEENDNIVPVKMNLDILYEDDCLLIINKPAGIAVHPSILHFEDSLSNGIRFYFDSIGLKKKIRPVNRLDLDTSGIIVFAKNEFVQECLIRQMNNNIFKKEYIAIVTGHLKEKSGVINLPIARKENSIIERCISEKGQNAITKYEVIKELDSISVVKCFLETGRTHQIRVHFNAIGHPLIGDSLYGSKSSLINRQALHCYSISFVHPITKEVLNITCNLPKDMENIFKQKEDNKKEL
mgnify:CR=1 FL=1